MNKDLLSLSYWWVLSLSSRTRLLIQIVLSIIVGFSVFHGHFYLLIRVEAWYLRMITTGIFSFLVFMILSRQLTTIMGDYIEIEKKNSELKEKNALLESLRKELEEKNEQLNKLAILDPLTGANNRLLLNETIQRISSFAERHNENVYLLFFDLDGLKVINDTFGHATGDAALITVAKIIKNHLRKENPLFRIGGDEFLTAIIAKEQKDTKALAERISIAISEVEFFQAATKINLSISIGVHLFNKKNTIEEEIDHADKEMYAVKKNGR